MLSVGWNPHDTSLIFAMLGGIDTVCDHEASASVRGSSWHWNRIIGCVRVTIGDTPSIELSVASINVSENVCWGRNIMRWPHHLGGTYFVLVLLSRNKQLKSLSICDSNFCGITLATFLVHYYCAVWYANLESHISCANRLLTNILTSVGPDQTRFPLAFHKY